MKREEQNSLEKFIRENRVDLDPYNPPKGLWEKIAEELEEDTHPIQKNKGKVIQIPVKMLYRVAATLLIILGLIAVYQLIPQPSNQRQEMAQKVNLTEIDPELAEAEAYYTKLISQKKQEIEQFRSQRLHIEGDFYKDIEELDSLYVGLKNELYQVPAKERVVEAMIQNLRIRIEILNKQLEILNRIQKIQNGEENEKNKIST
ncbi:MAG: hypothetical protein NW226_11330 [Microscillaceae bacterium]|nr:hypothetical protein [Microscillaceae bacterium]